MRIVINSAHQRFGGATQVALSFIDECRKFPQHEFYVWVGPGIRHSLKEDTFPPNFFFRHFDFGVIDLRKTIKINASLRSVEKEVKPDVVIATSGPTYFKSSAPQIIGFNLPLYIYPESPFLREQGLHEKLKRHFKRILHFYFFKRDADFYVVQTDDVNSRVRKALKTDKVNTVTNTASNYYRDWKAYPAKLPEKEKGTFRFVTISSYYEHKNLKLIPNVLSELRRRGIGNVEFVLTLKKEDFEKQIVAQDGIYNVGPVKPEECPSLYHECDGMFLPTLAECFSASYPEAMLMEKPIVTTDLGFARSICADAALFFEAKNSKAAADQIEGLIEDQELQKDLVAKGKRQLKTFDSPQVRARKYIELCEKIALEFNSA